MEFLTGAMTFATITSLIGLYRSERSARKDRSLDDFAKWLRQHGLNQVVEKLEGNAVVARSLQSMIEDQHDQVITKLETLDDIMCSIAQHMQELGPFAAHVSVKEKLADQALSILRQMVNAGTGSQIRTGTACGAYAVWTGSQWQSLNCQDDGLLPADFAKLVELKLLLRTKENGLEVFKLTREGVAVGQASS